jgi:anti-sigma factor RsiW
VADRHVSGDRLSAFLDDELTEYRAAAVTQHLAACDDCLTELEGLRAARDALRSLPELHAPATARQVPGPPRRRDRARRRLKVLAAAVAVPMTLGVAAYVAGGSDGEVSPSEELFLVEHVSRTGGGPVPGPVGGESP